MTLTSGEERAPTRTVVVVDSELSLDVDTVDGGYRSLRRTPRSERIFQGIPPSQDPEEPVLVVVAVARGGAYHGGLTDKRGKPRRSLQAYLAGDAAYVALAFDRRLYETGALQYGDSFRIRELDVAYGIHIPCRAVDASPTCAGQGFTRVDVCVATSLHARDPLLNARLTLLAA